MAASPFRLWFIPATLLRLSLSTIMVVVACIAGHWKAPPSDRVNMARNTCHSCTVPVP